MSTKGKDGAECARCGTPLDSHERVPPRLCPRCLAGPKKDVILPRPEEDPTYGR
jgi:hypothetical protein